MKYYLIALLVVIMGAGGRAMFEIAFIGASREHEFAPDNETQYYIGLVLWYVLMMIADVLLLNYKQISQRNLFIVLLSVGVLAPAVYMLIKH